MPKRNKILPETVEVIRFLRQKNVTYKVISELLGISQTMAWEYANDIKIAEEFKFPEIDNITLSYVAGVFDSRGFVTLYKKLDKRVNKKYDSINIRIYNKDKTLIDFI